MLQKSSVVGDIEKNYKVLKESYKKNFSKNCDFFLTTELFLSGYPPQDLIFRKDFLDKIQLYKKKIIKLTKNKKTIMLINIPEKKNKEIFNVLYLFENGKVVFKKIKSILPNYGVFDEKRYFSEGKINNDSFSYKRKKIKFLICEEMWSKKTFKKPKEKIDLLISINASPFEKKKNKLRIKNALNNAKFYKSDLIYINHIGCQDELVFDGGSFVMNSSGKIIQQINFFEEVESLIDLNKNKEKKIIKKESEIEHVYNALIFSLKYYMKNNNFKKVLIGLSGGIDSAFCLMVAADTLNPESINSFYLPTIYNSSSSKKDALELAKNLGVSFDTISIENLRKNILSTLDPLFKNLPKDVTEENIQSRLRGLLLMAISNKSNSLLITTGNKSELAVGYSTLYGDMCGGFSLIKDLYKTEIKKLADWRNKNIPNLSSLKEINLIPQNIIFKEPSAELKKNQKDIDTLPKYEILDEILELIIDKNNSLKSIKKLGFEEQLVKNIWDMIKKSEFKRYQSVIGPKISSMSFDKDRRFPITNKFLI